MINSTWEFDLREFQNKGAIVWHRSNRYVSCPAFVNGRDTVYVGTSRVTYKINKDGFDATPYWISPCLAREENNPEAEYTIRRAVIRYMSGAAANLTVEGSGDGGQTWVAGNFTNVVLAITTSSLNRAMQAFNVTGRDPRIRITYPSNTLVELFSMRVELIRRGNLKYE